MLKNIFLLKGRNLKDLDQLSIFCYPSEILSINDQDLIKQIMLSQDHHLVIENCMEDDENIINDSSRNVKKYVIDEPVPRIIDNLNIFITCINQETSLGLVFEKGDNPYDYKNIFLEIIHEYLHNEPNFNFEDELEVENFLITLFIGLRRYGDEIVEKKPQMEYHYQEELFFIKIFLFGLDEVGKSSLVRRIKTGKFDDNYFTPTRKFNIEYIQDEGNFLALWDMPGQRAFRKKWLLGLQDSNIIIFMIDVANQLRFEEAKKEFWNILNRFELVNIPLLILGNKIDLINHTLDNRIQEKQIQRLKNEIYEFFEFDKISNREWKFLFTSVKTNFHITQILKIISDFIQNNNL